MTTTQTTIDFGTPRTVRKMAANQNTSLVQTLAPLASAPQWYDVKLLIEQMFDARTRVRDAIEMRRASDMVSLRIVNSSRPAGAGLYGHDLEIAVCWHAYRRASASYHRAWTEYQKNLGQV